MAMTMKEIQAVAEQLRNEATMAYRDGVQYALEYLSDLYEGIEETDISNRFLSCSMLFWLNE